MSVRDKVMAGGRAKTRLVDLKISEDETVQVEVRGLTQNARGRLLQGSVMKVTHEDGTEEAQTDLVKLQPSLIIECAYDPATGERLFTEHDREALGEMEAAYLDPIISAASELSGLGKDAVKAAEGN